jgi:hypothetical protein
LDVLLGGGRRGRILRGDPFHSVGTRIGWCSMIDGKAIAVDDIFKVVEGLGKEHILALAERDGLSTFVDNFEV